jgi:hypothetical protein
VEGALKDRSAVSLVGMLVSMGLIPMSKPPKKDDSGYYYERRTGERIYSPQAEDAYRSYQFASNLGFFSGIGFIGFGGWLALISVHNYIQKKN